MTRMVCAHYLIDCECEATFRSYKRSRILVHSSFFQPFIPDHDQDFKPITCETREHGCGSGFRPGRHADPDGAFGHPCGRAARPFVGILAVFGAGFGAVAGTRQRPDGATSGRPDHFLKISDSIEQCFEVGHEDMDQLCAAHRWCGLHGVNASCLRASCLRSKFKVRRGNHSFPISIKATPGRVVSSSQTLRCPVGGAGLLRWEFMRRKALTATVTSRPESCSARSPRM